MANFVDLRHAADVADHYFSSQPATRSAPAEVVVDAGLPPGRAPLRLTTDAGTFSHGRLDRGTAALLAGAPEPRATGRFVDLGAGSGAIALTLAARSPDATVLAVDVNERARALCRSNASRNGLHNVTVVAPEEVGDDEHFDLIWSNPPIRIGKPALHALLRTWLGRLTPTGTAALVVHKNLGADSLHAWLVAQGWETQRLSSTSGYRLLHVTATAP